MASKKVFSARFEVETQYDRSAYEALSEVSWKMFREHYVRTRTYPFISALCILLAASLIAFYHKYSAPVIALHVAAIVFFLITMPLSNVTCKRRLCKKAIKEVSKQGEFPFTVHFLFNEDLIRAKLPGNQIAETPYATMALMTGEQYIESIRKMNMEIYQFGKKVENPVDDPILRPSLNSVRMTYDLAQQAEYQDLMTVISPETGERINRFTHIHRSTEDLRNKVKMQRLCGQKTAACFQRCVGMDAFNAEYSTTFEIDKKYGTHYHENFKKFMFYAQENDLTVDGAVTTSRNDIDYVVTEYGIAKLKGETNRQRAKNLINIAHPDFREDLKKVYEERFHCSFDD